MWEQTILTYQHIDIYDSWDSFYIYTAIVHSAREAGDMVVVSQLCSHITIGHCDLTTSCPEEERYHHERHKPRLEIMWLWHLVESDVLWPQQTWTPQNILSQRALLSGHYSLHLRMGWFLFPPNIWNYLNKTSQFIVRTRGTHSLVVTRGPPTVLNVPSIPQWDFCVISWGITLCPLL